MIQHILSVSTATSFSVSVSYISEFAYAFSFISIMNGFIFSIASKLINKFVVFLKIFGPQTVKSIKSAKHVINLKLY